MSCCCNKGGAGAQNGRRQSSGGQNPPPVPAPNVRRQSNSGNARRPSSGGNVRRPSSGGQNAYPGDVPNVRRQSNSGNARRPSSSGQNSYPKDVADLGTQDWNREDYLCKCGLDGDNPEEDYEDEEEEEEIVVPFRIQLKNDRGGRSRENSSPILTFTPTENGVSVNVKTFPGFDSEDEEDLNEECEEVGACGKPTCRGPSSFRSSMEGRTQF